jgi:predicted AlkP superfamily phosphohydrolase/phosphomutase
VKPGPTLVSPTGRFVLQLQHYQVLTTIRAAFQPPGPKILTGLRGSGQITLMTPTSRRLWPPVLPVLVLLVLAPAPAPAPGPTDGARVVVLGFDGADARTIEELVAARPGAYPTFERLAREGTFGRLETVAPPESPVSWAALNTGQNPAKTGVPGFVKRAFRPGPTAWFGHVITTEPKRLAEFEDTPLPIWSPAKMGVVFGVVVALFFLLVFAVLLRLKLLVSAVLALTLGGVGGWCGYAMRGMLADEYPRTSNPNMARNFWDYLQDAGVEATILDAAQAFDMPSEARVLAGLGVPDAKGGLGDWAIYTSADEVGGRPVFKGVLDGGEGNLTAGRLFKVAVDDDRVESRVLGPKNFWAEERLKKKDARLEKELSDPSLGWDSSLDLIEAQDEIKAQLAKVEEEGTWLPLVAKLGDGQAEVRLGLDAAQTIRVGEWSDYYHLTFELNWLLKVHAITRVKLVSLEPFELFLNVLDIDPEKPPFWQAISTPFAFSAELAREIGPYETYGWPTATMPMKDGVIAPELLMEDVEFTMGWRERMVYASLARDDWRVLMALFSTTDRVQHMMYQYYDEEHPLYDAAEAAKTFAFFGETITRKEAIPAVYKQMDRILGKVLDEHLGPDDTLLVCSDHGFQSFRRQFNVNNFLAEKGYLKTKPLTASNDDGLSFVDWSGTKAYGIGLGFIYLNLAGREPQGIVAPADADALVAQIKTDLLAYQDPKTGLFACKDVYVVKEVHQGPYLDQEADLICGFAPTYRVSWCSAFGGLYVDKNAEGAYVAGPTIIDNDKAWSGDHVSVSLPDVAGVLFSNRRVEKPAAGYHALQIAPTALALMGVPVPPEMDMAPLVVR